MLHRLLRYLFVIFCSSCLLACTTKQLLPLSSAPTNSPPAWLEQIKVGDTLEITFAQKKEPVKLKLTDISSNSLYGEKGEAVQIDTILSVEKVEFSWLKTTFLVLGVGLVAAAISFKNSVDDIDLGCVGYPGCTQQQ